MNCSGCSHSGKDCRFPVSRMSRPGVLSRLLVRFSGNRPKQHAFKAYCESGQLRVRCLAGNNVPIVVMGTADHAECYVRVGGFWILGGWRLQSKVSTLPPFIKLAESVNKQKLYTDAAQLPARR